MINVKSNNTMTILRKENNKVNRSLPDGVYIHYVSRNHKDKEIFKRDNYDYFDYPENERSLSNVANIHTHGMEKYGHKNLCIPMALNTGMTQALFNIITKAITESDDFNFDNVHTFDYLIGFSKDGKAKYSKPIYVGFQKVICCDEPCYMVVFLNGEDYYPAYSPMDQLYWNEELLNDLDIYFNDWVDTNSR